LVRLLIGRGLDLNAVNDRGETALHGAASRGYPQVVKLLVDRGANTAARTTAGRSALDLADPVVKDLLGDLKK
jgi:uncharacterized protein